jgi:hypothetical protein
MRLLDRMESLAIDLDMPSVRPNQHSYNIALSVITNSAARLDTFLTGYFKGDDSYNKKYLGNKEKKENAASESGVMNIAKMKKPRLFNPLNAGMAVELILSSMLSHNHCPDVYTFASVLNTYQQITNGKLEAALAANIVVRGMELLHLRCRINDPPNIFHYTMVCACWLRSRGELS